VARFRQQLVSARVLPIQLSVIGMGDSEDGVKPLIAGAGTGYICL